MSDVATTSKQNRSMPAWLMSGVLHVLALLALAILTNSMMRRPADVADRPVAIVLAKEDAGDIEYLGETSDASEESAEKDETPEKE